MRIKSLSIFIFAYNEANNLLKVISEANNFLINNVDDFELIVINDCSTDSTLELLTEFQKEISFNLINHTKNAGIGGALKTGYSESLKQRVVGIPGDGQFNIEELLLIKNWDENEFYSFHREDKNYNWFRAFLTNFNLFLIKNVLKNKLKDVNWIKVYTKKQLEESNPELNSSLIESEISSKLIRRGYQFVEFPSEYRSRISGKSKGGNIFTVTKAFIEMLKLIKVVRSFSKKIICK